MGVCYEINILGLFSKPTLCLAHCIIVLAIASTKFSNPLILCVIAHAHTVAVNE